MKREGGKDLVKVQAPTGLPAYLMDHIQDDTSLEAMQEYRILPRLKIIQSMASQELLQKFDPGCIIFQPGAAVVSMVNKKTSASDKPFKFVPLFFFVEFCKWADREDKKSSSIMDRTFDPASDLASRARDKNLRFEKYGDGNLFQARYVEHLNFPGFVYSTDHQLRGECCVLGFCRGEFGTGRNFISAVSMRKAPLWSQVFEMNAGFRDRGAKKWWGIDYKIPEDGPLIDEKDVAFFKQTHQELKDLYAKKKLGVDRSEQDEDSGEDAETLKESKF